MSDSTERMDDGQGTARMDAGMAAGTARMDAGTARIGGSQGASPAGGGTIFADGQTIVLNGNNCLIESLVSMGSGEAVVYKIQIDGKPYALKHYKPNTPLSNTAKSLLTKIRDNPRDRIVKIFDFGNYNGQDFEIMEYAEGGTLGEYLRKGGAIRNTKLKDMVKQINEGLSQLHGYYKAIYQDLKPENIFFRDAERSSLVLADFGISSVMPEGSEEVEVVASNTDLYGAPELARKGNNTTVDVSPAVDYFALGITVYELWLGEQPFKQIKPTTRERRIRDKNVDFPMDMPSDCKTLIQGLIDPLPKDRMGNEHIQKWLRGEALTLDTAKPAAVTGIIYKPLKFGNEFASNPKEMAALMGKYPEVGKDSLYDEIITVWLKEAGDLMLRSEIKNVVTQYGNNQEAGLTAAIYTLDPERPFTSRAGKTCNSNEDIAEAIIADSAHYMEDLKDSNAGLYIYIAATGGSQGKEAADNFYKYFKEYPPNRALTLVYLKLQSDGGINLGSKRYLSPDELAQEKDDAQINFIKLAVKEKDSKLLVWLSDRYGDYFKSTEEFGKQSIPDQFFLLGILPFLSFKELSGSNGEAALQDLINFYPGRSDLFEAYVAQNLPLKGYLLDNQSQTPIDYVVRNFNDLSKMHGDDTIFNLIRLLQKLGADVNEYSNDCTGPFMNSLGKDDNLVRLLLELGAEGDFVSHAGKVCKCGIGEEIADALMAESNYYKKDLKRIDANLYLYFAATEGADGRGFAQTCLKYFNEYSPERALALVYIQLQNDLGITLGSKHYKSLEELAQENDSAQLDLVKNAINEKDSLLLVWVSFAHAGRFDSTEAYGNLTIPDRFFLMGVLPFLSYKDLTSDWEETALSDLRFLIDNVPGRSDLFEAYVAQGLQLKGQILDSPVKKTAIDYTVCNFNDLEKHGADNVRNLIRLLCKLGADVNEYSSDSTCPLINAFESFLAGKNDLINLLLVLGADPNQYRKFLESQEEKERKEQEKQIRIRAEQRERQEKQEIKEHEKREKERLKRESAVKRGKIVKLSLAAIIMGMAVVGGFLVYPHIRNFFLYRQATAALTKADYETAVNNFQTLGDYRDAPSLFLYAQAEDAVLKGDYKTAIENFETLKDFRDAKKRLQQTTVIAGISEKSGKTVSWLNITNDVLSHLMGSGNRHTVGLGADGRVFAAGHNPDGRGNVSGWRNIVAVSARVGGGHTVGLRSDGTVIATGYNEDGQCNVSAWRNIVDVSAGEDHTVGLRTDGTVIAVGKNSEKQCNVSGWSDISAVSAGGSHTLGIRTDGTVVSVGRNNEGQCNASIWKNIVALSAGGSHSVGLQADGTVVSVGRNNEGQCNVSGWKNIITVSAGGNHTVGLQADGKVVATGRNTETQCNVSEWVDIVAISAGGRHTLGLRSDGTIVSTGSNAEGQRNVSEWKIDWQKIAIDQAERVKGEKIPATGENE